MNTPKVYVARKSVTDPGFWEVTLNNEVTHPRLPRSVAFATAISATRVHNPDYIGPEQGWK